MDYKKPLPTHITIKTNQIPLPAIMLYRRFGKTEIQMPVLSLGFMRSMHQWQDLPVKEIPQASQNNLRAIVERAMQLGINHFETARGYGSSERQLGLILQDLQGSEITVQTKISANPDPDDFSRQFLDSLERLGLERVDLLAIHGINDHRTLWYSCRKNGCLAAARRLQAQGKVGHIGFSGHGSNEIMLAAIRHEKDGGFDYLNLHWYYIFQIHRQAIQEAKQRDLGVFIISPTDKGGMLNTPSAQIKKGCAPLSAMLFNDLFCLSNPEVQTISIGASSPNDFAEHIKVLDLLNEGNGRQLEQIDTRLKKLMQEETGYARPDWMWQTLPEWEKSPGYINIPMIIWLFNLARGWGLLDFARRRYQQLGHDMPWVPGCNAAEVDRYDLAKVLQNAPLPAEKIIDLLKKAHALLGEEKGTNNKKS